MATILKVENDETPFTNVRVSKRQVILAVDDMPANLSAIINLLPETYEVRPAKSGKDALDMLSHFFVDLALLDIEMPGMSGLELFEKMQENPATKGIPVIFVTSDKDGDTVRKTIGMGARDYIGKPFDAQTLVTKVRRALSLPGEDQAIVFLELKIRQVIDCCAHGDTPKAEAIMKELPQDVYSRYVFLKFSRIQTALHNRDFGRAKTIAEEMIKELKAAHT